MLSERLFCTTLKRVPMAPGETWALDVQKLEACHSTEGVLGHLYLDLSQREGARSLLQGCLASHSSSALLGESNSFGSAPARDVATDTPHYPAVDVN